MQATIDIVRNRLIKRYHTLLGKLNISNDEKLIILSSYGVSSSKDLDTPLLIDLCDRLSMQLHPVKKGNGREHLQSMVIACIGGWLRALGKDGNNIKLILSIASRAAEVETVSEITVEKLRAIYYAFLNKQKALAFVDKVTAEEIEIITSSN